MTEAVLIVAVEAGAAAYVRPLLERLTATAVPGSWRVVLGPVAAKTLSGWGCAKPPVVPFEPEGPEALSSALGDWAFDVLLTSASASPIEHTVHRIARRRGARILAYIDAFTGYDERFEVDGDWLEPDAIFVVDADMKAEAGADGLPADRLIIVGQPAWEKIVPLTAAPAGSVLFAAQPARRHYGDTLPYDEHSAWRMLVEAHRLRPDVIERLVYAAHPAMQSPPSQSLDEFEVTRDPQSALEQCGTVAGMFSSLMVEALLAGRQAISLQPGLPARDMCPLSRRGCIDRVGGADELVVALQRSRRDDGSLRAALDGSLDRLWRHVLVAS